MFFFIGLALLPFISLMEFLNWTASLQQNIEQLCIVGLGYGVGCQS